MPCGTGAGGAGDSLLQTRAGSMASPQNGKNADRVSLSVPQGDGKTQERVSVMGSPAERREPLQLLPDLRKMDHADVRLFHAPGNQPAQRPGQAETPEV